MKTIAAVTQQHSPAARVRDIVNPRTCLTFMPQEKASEIVRGMHGHHSGAAGVVDAKGRFIGLITEREILRRLFRMQPETAEQQRFAEEDKPVLDLTAWDVMIAAPQCLTEDMAIEEALARITGRGYRYMPVVRSGGADELLGIVSERELFMHVQEKTRRELQAKDTLLSYFMHHEPYGFGASAL